MAILATVSGDLLPTLEAQESLGLPAGRLALVVIAPHGVDTHPLPPGGALTVGRATDSEVVVDDPLISRVHARLVVGERLEIEDLGSANGTKVDGSEIPAHTRVPLQLGQVVDLGNTILVVQRLAEGAVRRRLFSHAYLEVRLEEECARATSGKRTPFAFARLRVSGELARDVLERELTGVLRGGDVIASFARGHYELLLVDTTRAAARSALDGVVAHLEQAGARVAVGLASYPEDGITSDALMDRAASALAGLSATSGLDRPIVLDPTMRDLYRVIERVGQGTISILLLGETGVGKELVAEAVHRASPRVDGPFVRLNCAALSESLIESELFGHEKGAFTGAANAKAGLLEAAEGGTMFLDEVGELPLGTQAKLLRVIEQREVLRVGSLKPKAIDVRFVSATNRNLEQEVAAGRFRQDLFFRLNGVALRVPPLRERVREIEPLAKSFIARAAAGLGRPAPALSPEAVALLERYAWPGNIRELRNMMERAVLLSTQDAIEAEHLPLDKLSATWGAEPPREGPPGLTPEEQAARARILQALERCAHNQTRAAEILGVSRQTLSKWLARYDLPRPRKS